MAISKATSPDRDVYIYLPPSYAYEPQSAISGRLSPPRLRTDGRAMDVVHQSRRSRRQGHRRRNDARDDSGEPGCVHKVQRQHVFLVADDGDWESYIAEDLVAYVDSITARIANRASRGLGGHSMGGYGTIRIGMKRPDVFSSLYIMSACCLMNAPFPTAAIAAQARAAKAHEEKARARKAHAVTVHGRAGAAASATCRRRSPQRSHPIRRTRPTSSTTRPRTASCSRSSSRSGRRAHRWR